MQLGALDCRRLGERCLSHGFVWNRRIPHHVWSPPLSISDHLAQAGADARAEEKLSQQEGGKTGTTCRGLPASLKHEFGALCLKKEANGDCAIFGGTDGPRFLREDNGESWTLITDRLAPISKKGHERLLAAS